jgi:glucose-6-phosphate 1-dehydrogenase
MSDLGRKPHIFAQQLAVPPSQFTSLAQMLAKNNKPNSDNKANTKTLSSRLVIEKPFGKDSESCQKMMKDIAEAGWEQKEIYRVDHFAAIETVSRLEIPHGRWHDHFRGSGC